MDSSIAHQTRHARHAVLTAEQVVWISEQARKLERHALPIHAQHVSELWAMGKDLDISHFWIMPDSPIEGMGYSFLSEKAEYDIFVTMGDRGEDKPERPRSARCTKDGQEIKIGYPAREPFGWTVSHPLDILAAIDYLQQVLPVTVQWSPQSMGERLLRDQYRATKRLQSYVADSTVDLAALPFRKAAPDLMFLRPFTPDMVGQWFHLYDKNAAHPTAASMITTGIGDPVHLTSGNAEFVSPTKPGIYRVSVHPNGSPFDGVQLPPVIASEWVTLNVLKFARQKGYTIHMHEAWVFEQSHRLFEKWFQTLWAARQELKDTARFKYEPGRENAYWTAKDIANRTISTLRENWWADMVGQSRVAKLANLEKWAKEGYTPQLIWYDDMGFVSSEPNPETAIPGIFERRLKSGEVVDNRNEPGGYKHKYSVLLTAEMVSDLQKLNKPNQALTYLKRIAEQKGCIVNA